MRGLVEHTRQVRGPCWSPSIPQLHMHCAAIAQPGGHGHAQRHHNSCRRNSHICAGDTTAAAEPSAGQFRRPPGRAAQAACCSGRTAPQASYRCAGQEGRGKQVRGATGNEPEGSLGGRRAWGLRHPTAFQAASRKDATCLHCRNSEHQLALTRGAHPPPPSFSAAWACKQGGDTIDRGLPAQHQQRRWPGTTAAAHAAHWGPETMRAATSHRHSHGCRG